MPPDWTPLRAVLRQFRAAQVTLPLWWRDDDAIAPTPALDQLHDLSAALGLPVHIAVIPDLAQQALGDSVQGTDRLIALVHGWQHRNNAPEGAKKAEFGSLHANAPAQIERAMTRMRALFGNEFLPVFVPPWNRMHPDHNAALRAAGFRGLSAFTPRGAARTDAGLVQINCHIDPIDWRGSRDLKHPDQIVAETVANLIQRLRGETDASEPLGYLTHHLVHTPALWDFTEQYLSEMLEGGATIQPLAPLLETA